MNRRTIEDDLPLIEFYFDDVIRSWNTAARRARARCRAAS
jgi:hypothetical protein